LTSQEVGKNLDLAMLFPLSKLNFIGISDCAHPPETYVRHRFLSNLTHLKSLLDLIFLDISIQLEKGKFTKQ